jgi:hypothetical protein
MSVGQVVFDQKSRRRADIHLLPKYLKAEDEAEEGKGTLISESRLVQIKTFFTVSPIRQDAPIGYFFSKQFHSHF